MHDFYTFLNAKKYVFGFPDPEAFIFTGRLESDLALAPK
jgi:hypothetical protein